MIEIRCYPDPVLKQRSQEIENIDKEIKKLTQDMFEVMYANKGVGLAAPQIGVLKRIITVDVSGSEKKESPMVLINPIIVDKEGEEESEEGCLSLPGFKCKVKRASKVRVRYTDLEGEDKIINATELLAICLQHEIDHLNGRLIIDYAGKLKRAMYDKRIKKMKKKHRR